MRKVKVWQWLVVVGAMVFLLPMGLYLHRVHEITEMDQMLRELPDPYDGGEFDSWAYVRAAMALQGVGKERACDYLLTLAKQEDKDRKHRVMVLCRMLFAPRVGEEFRAPALGIPGYIHEQPEDRLRPGGAWDLYGKYWGGHSIVVVEGIPFRIATGYALFGYPEPSTMYLEYCISQCEWSTYCYQEMSDEEVEHALQTLYKSENWKRPLGDPQKSYVSNQIRRR